MVKLRLTRGGRKKRPFYRLVAAHSTSKRDGKYIERLGSYNPLESLDKQISINEDRVMYWLKNGAVISDTTRSILKREGLMLKFHMIKKGMDEETIAKETAKFKTDIREKLITKAAKSSIKKQEVKKVEETVVKAEKAPAPAPEVVEAAAPVMNENVEVAANTETAETTTNEAPAEPTAE